MTITTLSLTLITVSSFAKFLTTYFVLQSTEYNGLQNGLATNLSI